MSRAQALFQQIVGAFGKFDSIDDLRSWIDGDPPKEDQILDYKAASQITGAKALDKNKLKAIWSEACSGFANTSGGVLIFGIATHESGDSNRSPSKPALCFDLVKTEELLLMFAQNNCDPPVQNIEAKAFNLKEKEDGPEGVVVCLVPESSTKPHKAMQAAKPDYYLRLQDGFYSAPHSILRALFNSSSRPEVELRFSYRMNESPKLGALQCDWEIQIRNPGSVSLADPVVVFRPIDGGQQGGPTLGNWGETWTWNPQKTDAHRNGFIRGMPLHPDEHDAIVRGKFLTTRIRDLLHAGERSHAIGMEIEVFARDMVPRRFRFFETYRDLMSHHTEVWRNGFTKEDQTKVVLMSLDAEGKLSMTTSCQERFPSGREK